ncbi:MAG TPA: hypothetical protein VFF68_00635 [Anaerolineaceae bacterium]|nr:hypothetical protein [Anaerolineaceae bacterium]
MQIAPLTAASGLGLVPPPNPEKPRSPAAGLSEGFRPSEWSLLAASYGLTELSYHSSGVQFAYHASGNLALRASSTVDFHLRSETVTLDLVVPAESFGDSLPAEWFANGPLKLTFEYSLQTKTLDHKTEIRTVKTLRKPEEILRDLGKALGEVLREKGDKSINVAFDEEAIGVLFSDPAFSRLLDELVGLISMINTLRLEGGPRQRYWIEVSGKGQPYLDVQSQTRVEIEETRVQVNLVILPAEAKVGKS